MLTCCVPFCRRTTRQWSPPAEWLCGDHWKLVPMRWRQVFRRVLKRSRGRSQFSDRIWRRMKGIAIERAAGVSR